MMMISGEVINVVLIYLVQNTTNYHFWFDFELDKFGVEFEVLKDPVTPREFVGWIEDWENKLKKKNFPVVEAYFLTKYKNLSFLFEDNNKLYSILKEMWSSILRENWWLDLNRRVFLRRCWRLEFLFISCSLIQQFILLLCEPTWLRNYCHH